MEGVEVMAEDSEPLDPPIPRSSLIQDVICAILAGKTAKDIHVMHGVDAQALQRLKNSTEFNREMYVARRNVTTAVTEWIKRKTPELAMKMHALATTGEDARTQFAAVKDLLDRAGMGPTQKVALSTPQAYKDAIAELQDDVPVNEGESGDGDRT